MIFYFSATGNSKYVTMRLVEALQDRSMSVTDCPEGAEYPFTPEPEEPIGIVTPTYDWRLPLPVEEFVRRLRLPDDYHGYLYTVATYGTTPGQTGYFIRKLLEEKGLKLDAAYGVRMPDTWTPLFDLSDPEKVAEINRKAEILINGVIAQIRRGDKGNFQHPHVPYASRFVTKAAYDNVRRTSHFHVEDSCIGCGLCAKKCPAHAIELQDKRPVWVRDRCYMCLGCLHRCPKFAIQYENRTKKHGQYRNPNVKV